MSAAFAAFGDDSSCTVLFHHPGNAGGSHNRNDFNACCQPAFHITAGVACTGGDDGYLFLNDQFGGFFHKGAHEHNIHAEGLVGHLTALADFGTQLLAVGIHSSNNAQTACIGNTGSQAGIGYPCHTALENGILDTQHLTDGCADHNQTLLVIHSLSSAFSLEFKVLTDRRCPQNHFLSQ